jgi:hypothetical protein
MIEQTFASEALSLPCVAYNPVPPLFKKCENIHGHSQYSKEAWSRASLHNSTNYARKAQICTELMLFPFLVLLVTCPSLVPKM